MLHVSSLITHLWDSWIHYNKSLSSIIHKKKTEDKVIESVHTPKVVDSGTFGLWTTSLNWQTIWSAILKEFYCNLTLFSIHTQVLSQDGYIEAGWVWNFEGTLFIVLSLLSVIARLTLTCCIMLSQKSPCVCLDDHYIWCEGHANT
jgi:hypothetical protein